MKIIIYTPEAEMINVFNKYKASKSSGKITSKLLSKPENEFIIVRTEKNLFDFISGDDSVSGFAIHCSAAFSKKSIDFIKRKNSYVPVLIFGEAEFLLEILGADIYMPFTEKELPKSYHDLFELIYENILNYSNSFDKLKKLTAKMSEVIEFGNCKYDPVRRIFYYNNKEIKKLSAKEGGILEILSSNYAQVVKREIILEKVWRKSDYFSGRSMDVYITHLRGLFSEKEIDLSIKNISGVGLILE